jgi:threonine/homoserine/homoserine lactone efflux protein
MPDPSTLAVFVAACFVLLITPGPAVLFIVTRSLDGGPSAGIAATLGVATGTLCHVTAAALGLSTLLLTSALAFNVVKYAGAAYLIYLGIRSVTDSEAYQPVHLAGARTLPRIWVEAIMLQLLNPKVALFLVALLPQFIDPSKGEPSLQVFVFGITLVALGLITDGSYAVGSSVARKWLQNAPVIRGQRRLAGTLLVGLGVAAALSGPTDR